MIVPKQVPFKFKVPFPSMGGFYWMYVRYVDTEKRRVGLSTLHSILIDKWVTADQLRSYDRVRIW